MNSYALRPWHVSLLVHFAVVGIFFLVTQVRTISFEVIEVPIEVAPPKDVQNLNEVKEKPKVVLKSVNKNVESGKPVREVFGASKHSYTDEGGEIAAKKGNTLAKESDKKVLLDSDADSLPTPTEEYLVSEMPIVLSEVKPNYPKDAKEKQIEGAVSLDILIDDQGNVRQVTFVEGPEIFRSGAIEAMKKFKFKPARVEGKPVAVRIRYLLRFELEF